MTVHSQRNAINVSHIMSYKFNVGKVNVFVKVCKDTSSLSWIKILGLNITLFEEIVVMGKTFV